ncbi:MAG: hypothetical protein SAMD01599839_03470 [Rectinema sp.]
MVDMMVLKGISQFISAGGASQSAHSRIRMSFKSEDIVLMYGRLEAGTSLEGEDMGKARRFDGQDKQI